MVDEGPFQNFVAVHFPEDEFYVSTLIDNTGSGGIASIGIAPYPDGRVAAGSDMQGIATGQTSGTVVDLTNVPANVGAPFILPNFSPPPCLFTPFNLYDLAGNALTAAPFLGYNIQDAGISIISYYSATWDGMQCNPDGNAPSPPGFILGEKVSIVVPE